MGGPASTAPRPVIYMRRDATDHAEVEAAREFFKVLDHRAGLLTAAAEPAGEGSRLVIPRYSMLPFPDELERDVRMLGCQLLNTAAQHRFVADIGEWYGLLEDLTPRTWMCPADVPRDQPGSFVLKGRTNSRKQRWSQAMFAEDRSKVATVLDHLLDDSLTAQQGIVVREFEPFRTFGYAMGGLPITDEWRYFCLDGQILAHGFYWSDHLEVDAFGALVAGKRVDWTYADLAPRADFVREVCSRIHGQIRFVVVDVARHQDGRFRLVELNDGCMSGLSTIDPRFFYEQLAARL